MSVKDIPNFEQLTDLERLGLAEELIASLRNPEALPAPLAHRLELEKRWSLYEKDPSSALSEDQFWNEVRAHKAWKTANSFFCERSVAILSKPSVIMKTCRRGEAVNALKLPSTGRSKRLKQAS